MTTPERLVAGAMLTIVGTILLSASRDGPGSDDIKMFAAGLLLILIGWTVTGGVI